jgi:hypothetical protein
MENIQNKSKQKEIIIFKVIPFSKSLFYSLLQNFSNQIHMFHVWCMGMLEGTIG